MALTDLLKSLVRASAFGLALYACGGEEKSCQTDNDCREPRVCVRGYCQNSAGINSRGDGACGDSPFNDMYLTFLGCCKASIYDTAVNNGWRLSFLDSSTCTAYGTYPTGEKYTEEYSGTWVSDDCELVKEYPCSEIEFPDPEGYCPEYQCALAQNENLYVLECEGKVPFATPHLYVVTPHRVDRAFCEEEWSQPWADCFTVKPFRCY